MWSNYPFFIFLCPKIVSVKKTKVFGFGYVFKKHEKIWGHSQNFTDTIWIVQGVFFTDIILGHWKMKNG